MFLTTKIQEFNYGDSIVSLYEDIINFNEEYISLKEDIILKEHGLLLEGYDNKYIEESIGEVASKVWEAIKQFLIKLKNKIIEIVKYIKQKIREFIQWFSSLVFKNDSGKTETITGNADAKLNEIVAQEEAKIDKNIVLLNEIKKLKENIVSSDDVQNNQRLLNELKNKYQEYLKENVEYLQELTLIELIVGIGIIGFAINATKKFFSYRKKMDMLNNTLAENDPYTEKLIQEVNSQKTSSDIMNGKTKLLAEAVALENKVLSDSMKKANNVKSNLDKLKTAAKVGTTGVLVFFFVKWVFAEPSDDYED